MDSNTLQAIDQFKQTTYSQAAGAALIFKIDMINDLTVPTVEKILTRYQASNVKMTSDEDEQAAIIELRQAMLPAIFTGRNAVMEDMAVPTSKLAELVAYIQQVSEETGI